MFLLYYGSGSRELDLMQETNSAIWGLMRKKAVNYLTISGAKESASLLSQLPFEHWAGTNSFGDEFDLLYLRISIAQYLKMKLDAETPVNRQRFRLIADAMEEGGNPIRFIAVTMIDDNADAVSTPHWRSPRQWSNVLYLISRPSSNRMARSAGLIAFTLHCTDISSPSARTQTSRRRTTQTSLHSSTLSGNSTINSGPSLKMLRGLAQIIDAMNPVRNHSSLAHPNDELLEEPEAMLAANAVRSLLHYLNMKLS
jgi:hypothetical protein